MKIPKELFDSITKPNKDLMDSARNPLRSYARLAGQSISSLAAAERSVLAASFAGLASADSLGAAGLASSISNRYAENLVRHSVLAGRDEAIGALRNAFDATNSAGLAGLASSEAAKAAGLVSSLASQYPQNYSALGGATIDDGNLKSLSGSTAEARGALRNALDATYSTAMAGLASSESSKAAGLVSSLASQYAKNFSPLAGASSGDEIFKSFSGFKAEAIGALRDALEATSSTVLAGFATSQAFGAARLVSSIVDQCRNAVAGNTAHPLVGDLNSYKDIASQIASSFALSSVISSYGGKDSSSSPSLAIVMGVVGALASGVDPLVDLNAFGSSQSSAGSDNANQSIQPEKWTTFQKLTIFLMVLDIVLTGMIAWISAAPSHPKQIAIDVEPNCTSELCVVTGTKQRRVFGEPRKSGTVVTRISAGTKVRPLHQSEQWQLIEFLTENGERLKGWIEIDALEDFRARLSEEIVTLLSSQNKPISKVQKKPETFAVPKIIKNEGQPASKRFLEFFAANIRNKNTRLAYAKACESFLYSMEISGLALHMIEPLHVAVYVEKLTQERSPATVKQHVAAIRQMFDYLVTGQIIPSNPASSVKPPKHVSDGGKTPILQAEELRQLFASLNPDVLIDARDRAILAVMTFSFARVGAVVKLRVRDYYRQGAQAWFLLREKGGRDNKVPVHHEAANYVERFIELAGLADQREMPLFRSFKGRTGALTVKPMLRGNVFDMIRRRAAAVGLPVEIGCHSFRGSGITNYLSNGGTLEVAARIAGHRSTTTTQLYDRRNEQVSQTEIERIRF